MEKKEKKTDRNSKENIAEARNQKELYSLRGRKFEGYVIKKIDKRVTIEYEKVKYIKKYERYIKEKSKLHARLPSELINSIQIGDYIQITECRPLSKIIHFVVTKKIRSANSEVIINENKNLGERK
ncbi:MAG TPA: 30S ribosomal protein S17 [Candidatus Paceibacterota bacterium]|nr:30S ribosomal protein S17 [Candidatus Paceibacterota bacterium]